MPYARLCSAGDAPRPTVTPTTTDNQGRRVKRPTAKTTPPAMSEYTLDDVVYRQATPEDSDAVNELRRRCYWRGFLLDRPKAPGVPRRRAWLRAQWIRGVNNIQVGPIGGRTMSTTGMYVATDLDGKILAIMRLKPKGPDQFVIETRVRDFDDDAAKGTGAGLKIAVSAVIPSGSRMISSAQNPGLREDYIAEGGRPMGRRRPWPFASYMAWPNPNQSQPYAHRLGAPPDPFLNPAYYERRGFPPRFPDIEEIRELDAGGTFSPQRMSEIAAAYVSSGRPVPKWRGVPDFEPTRITAQALALTSSGLCDGRTAKGVPCMNRPAPGKTTCYIGH